MWLEPGELEGEVEPPHTHPPLGQVSPCWPGHSTQSKPKAAEDSLTKGPAPSAPVTTRTTGPSHPTSEMRGVDWTAPTGPPAGSKVCDSSGAQSA